MGEVLRILYGAGFTLVFCWAAGRLLLRSMRIRLAAVERQAIGFVVGAACVSLYTFVLCTLHLARRGVFQWSGFVVLGLALWGMRREGPVKRLPAAPRSWMAFFLVVLAVFFVIYFLHALAPETSPDGSGYHLGNVVRWWRAHGFVWQHHNMYSYLAQGVEMLFLVAFTFGRYSTAALVHLGFLVALAWMVVAFGRRVGRARVGVFAAVLVYASPVVGLDASVAYNDVALCAVWFAVVYLLHVWDEERDDKLLFLIGLLCGFAYSIKYTAAGAVVLAAGWVMGRRRMPWGVIAGAAMAAGPWVLRNWIWLGNPVAPFFNRWFPNQWYHPGMEEIYSQGLREYQDLEHAWQVPWELTMHGGAGVTGIAGAVFLLAPVALLALRFALGRRLLLAALVAGVAAFLNTGTRFLIPALPFVALAMGLALARSPGALPALALMQVVLAWPTVMPAYSHKYAWRIGSSLPVDAALRRIPEKEYLAGRIGDYPLLEKLNREVPPGGRVFSFAGRPEAYIDREVLVSYMSAEANLINDILLAAIDGYKPVARLRFAFAEQSLTGVRVVQTASGKPFWSVAEMRVMAGSRELPRDAGWRIAARPNAWEATLAFDNSPVTRWLSWEAMRPGQFVEVRFGRAERVSAVVLEAAVEGQSKPRLEGQGSDGRWQVLAARPEVSDVPAPRGMRRAAAMELKARGIHWMLVNDNEFPGEDMRKYPMYWGVTDLGEAGGTRFYRID